MHVFRSKRAERDLDEIWLPIARDNPRAADKMLDEFEARTALLRDHPRIGRLRPDIAAGVRHLVVGNYLILYRVSDDEVEIVRYVHGRRDPKDMM